jgi:hypothetical protein
VKCLHYCGEKLEDAEDALEDARIADAVEERRSFGHDGREMGDVESAEIAIDNI